MLILFSHFPCNGIHSICFFVCCGLYSVPICQMGGRVVRWCWVNFQCWDVLLIWIRVGQEPIALAVDAGGGLFGHFSFSILSLLFLPLSGRRPDID